MNVRALLVKTFVRETSETRGGFEPVPSGMNLAQAWTLLNQSEAASAERTASPTRTAAPTRTGNTWMTPAAFASRP
jgi:hypothetical protein